MGAYIFVCVCENNFHSAGSSCIRHIGPPLACIVCSAVSHNTVGPSNENKKYEETTAVFHLLA